LGLQHFNAKTSVDFRVAALVLKCDPANYNLDEKRSKHAGLAQQNGFGPAFWFRVDVQMLFCHWV
jgi:hypothetical protein